MEQRKARRFDLKLPFELIRSGSEPLSQHGETKNLSSAGVLFQSEADLHIGEPVEYLITLPTSPGEGERVRLHCIGKVVRFARKAEIAATLERYEFVR
jgi:PilZ domain